MQKQGYKIYLDFHFSDSWADPNKQPPPAAWSTKLKPLARTLRECVKDTLVSFNQAGITLDIVGSGSLHHNFSSFATLWKSARAGVDDALTLGVHKPQIMIHIDDGWNVTLQQRWFDVLTANGVHVREKDYPAICDGEYNPIPTSSEPEIPYTVDGQLEWTDDVISIVRNVLYGLERGVHY
ncbi:glycoside hydrolase family 53 protein [Sclerotinia borealis F-4128]|uniref:Arabinogalactan endo-beta-1,4-galactanase n=1 Tax=Sclerotinia borealis (strain F-4128) TaxID=1432307 RepID=W9CAZ2_SCLBF|nr:glycoside hydrolase family 53 protein [Sclerotinia borealis F-4128]